MRTRRSGIILTLATVLAVTLLDVGGTANADPQGDEPPTMAEKKLAEELSSESLQTEKQPVQEIEQLSAARKAAAAKEVRLTSNGAWSWYMDPRVLESSRATYLGYVARSGSVMLTSVRHSDSLMTTTTLRARQERDDHNAPALVQTPGRKIVAFWAGHALAPVRYRISRGADDISAMSATRSLKGSGLENAPATYVQVFYLRGSGRPYHLLTRRDSDRMWMLTTSKDLRTWSKAVEVIKRPSWDVDTWPYVEATSDGWRRIHL
ncbi:MAG TPA: BNR-4 repeat-containing protein, partial [Nocardioides sp.]